MRGQAATEEAAQGVSVLRSIGQHGDHLQVVPSLAELEQVIERGRQTFREVGGALTVIRDARLYLQTHPTFETYCRDRWGMSRPRAYQLIAAASVSTAVDIQNEHQARRLREKGTESIDDESSWQALADVLSAIEGLSSSDASTVASTVPPRRRSATARKLRKLGMYLGRVAWSLEGMESKQ